MSWEERMANRARTRNADYEAEQRREWEALVAESEQRAQENRVRLIAVGRPCEVCFLPEPRRSLDKFKRTPVDEQWEWQHGDPVNPVREVDDWGEYEFCTHACHEDGRYCTNAPPIALASG